jgi:hypothetical protein
MELPMLETYVERFPSRIKFMKDRIDFDPKNSEHRKAALKFFREGTWDIKFNAEWPCTTVPQTVLMKLAEFSCQKEMKAIHDAEGVKYVPFNAFNMHTHRPNMNPFPSVQVE